MCSSRASKGERRCTMICATSILLCYLFTCCTHLTIATATPSAAATKSTTARSQDTQQQQLPQLQSLAAFPSDEQRLQQLGLEAAAVGDNSGQDATRALAKATPSFEAADRVNVNREDNDNDINDDEAAELKHGNVHKLMSEQDLRRTFQVDSHDQVPEYEILKLTVNDDGSHLISPISDLGELTTTLTTKTSGVGGSDSLSARDQLAAAADVAAGRRAELEAAAATAVERKRTSERAAAEVVPAERGPTVIDRHKRSPSISSPNHDLEDGVAEAADEAFGRLGGDMDRLATGSISAEANAEKGTNRTRRKRENPAGESATVAGERNQKQQEPSSSTSFLSSDRNAEAKASVSSDSNNQDQDHEGEAELIVMKLSTFGKDFKLRLKRNADFQDRIKGMKMFMAESTEDGRLRYTEIKSSQPQHQHHKQEPHKRAANADQSFDDSNTAAADSAANIEPVLTTTTTIAANNNNNNSGNRQRQATTGKIKATGGEQADSSDAADRSSSSASAAAVAATNVWNIGSTYHDEDNLAALLIDHDRKTGQLQVDGTIGNDFVIKPMPQAAIDALLVKRQQELLRRQQREQQHLAPAKVTATEQLSSAQTSPRLDRQPATLTSAAAGNGNNALASPELLATKQKSADASSVSSAEGATAATLHMHDDDPHDDDEMFLDEDEALELAHQAAPHEQQAASGAQVERQTTISGGNNGTAPSTDQQSEQQQHRLNSQQLPQPRALSKAASERKWRKYRKLMAQTQVPKPGALAQAHDDQQQEQAAALAQVASSSSSPSLPSSSSSSPPSFSGQARGRRHAHEPSPAAVGVTAPKVVQVSHHIVYRQRPSSEGSSSEHQHSFMVSPGGEHQTMSAASMERMAASFAPQRLTKRSLEAGRLSASRHRDQQGGDNDADFEEDPLDGQFFLEPGSMTGFERAGHSDWSLLSRQLSPSSLFANTNITGGEQRRFKRQAGGSGGGRTNNINQGHHRNGVVAAGSQVRRKRQAPDTVWPEVLLVVDYDSFLLHGGDSRDVKRYFVSFWNGVDLRYKLLVHPHIRISLAGMIVAKDRDATPYLERNRLRAPNADAVDAAGALTDMGKYLYREDRLPTYDLAVVITKLDMCRRRYEGGRCNRGTAGFAYVGGACVVNKRLEKVNSVAIIEDSGGFSGIIVAAHEVGHLLGCVHDGSPPPSYLGGPGATHCPWEDGFIMSDLRHTERGFRWSQCSVEQFKHFLNGETATCLYNYPHESQMLHRLLPGTMLSLDEQCKRDRGTNACFKDARVCAQLFCFDSASGYCVSYRPAAEGSPCGEGQVCRNGKCVGEIENIIPDYTHQSQTVVARRPAASTAAGSHSQVARLADNGLSASSTSTATSSPDSKLPLSLPSIASVVSAASVASGNLPSVVNAPQLSSRMDTFTIDLPIALPSPSGGYSTSSALNHPSGITFGGRFGSTGTNVDGTASSTGLVLMRQQAPTTSSAVLAPTTTDHLAASTNLPKVPTYAGDYGSSGSTITSTITTSNNNNHSNNRQQQQQVHGFLQRTGLQVIPKGANQTPVKQYFINSNQHIGHSTPSAKYTSADTSMSHQYPRSSSSNINSNSNSLSNGNNLLTSNPITMAKQQQLYDNQRITYKPTNQQLHQQHHQDGQISSNTNYVNRINVNSHGI